jgi:hypothetical protein
LLTTTLDGDGKYAVAGIWESVGDAGGVAGRRDDIVARGEGLLDDLSAEPAGGAGNEPHTHVRISFDED